MNKDPYDLTPVQQKDIFTYTDMTEEDFENLVDNLFDRHAVRIGGHWENEDGLDTYTVHDFARDLRAVLASANGPLQATTSKPLSAKPWGGYTLTEMEELVQKTQQLERENAALREDKEALDWIDENVEAVFFKFKPDNFRLNIRESFRTARAKEAKP